MLVLKKVLVISPLFYYILTPQNDILQIDIQKQDSTFNETNIIPFRSLSQSSISRPPQRHRKEKINETTEHSSSTHNVNTERTQNEDSQSTSLKNRREKSSKTNPIKPTKSNEQRYNTRQSNNVDNKTDIFYMLSRSRLEYAYQLIDTLDLKNHVKNDFKEFIYLYITNKNSKKQYELYRSIKRHIKKYIKHPQLSSLIDFQTVEEDLYYKYYPDRQKYKETIL
ncbi:Plasmodium exported protein (hyp12), unknown, putative [Plasmodium sp. gorilla clade G3]|nr:Plasmodium exported protein (hyp12), unknown, putative [Plasmodium sp. gorilla clade G3]